MAGASAPGGQPQYSGLAITTALTLRAVFGLASGQTEGPIGFLIDLLRLDLVVPDHSTWSRRARTLPVPLRRRLGTGPLHLLVDSTGVKLGGTGAWLVEKHDASRRRSWRKLHIGVDADSGEIAVIELTKRKVDDGSQAAPLPAPAPAAAPAVSTPPASRSARLRTGPGRRMTKAAPKSALTAPAVFQ